MPKQKKKLVDEGQIDSVRSFALRHPGLNEGGVRWIIFQHKEKLIDAGAIFYCGKRLLIDGNRFISVIKQGGLNHG